MIRKITILINLFLLSLLIFNPSLAKVWPFPEGAGVNNQGVPTVDGTASGGGNVSSFTITLTTTVANDWIIIAAAQSANISSFISSISSTNTTGWQQRATGSRSDGGATITGSFWYGKATGVLSSEVITVNMSNGGGIVAAVAAGISNVQSSSCPFDSNGSIPNVNNGAPSTTATAILTTSNYHNLNLFMNFVSGSANRVLANYFEILYNNGFVTQMELLGQYTTLRNNGVTLTMGGTNASDWIAMADSLTSEVSSGSCPP